MLKDYHRKRIHFRDHPETLLKHAAAMDRWRAAGQNGRPPAHPNPVTDQHQSTVLWNAMIAPLVPYSIRGAIWYQGESNVGTRHLYPDLQRTLIEDWRSVWKNPEMPFYFVQLAAYQKPKPEPGDSSLATTRAAQATSLKLRNTGMAVTIDIGEAADIHPRNKQDVGHRLALLALARTYGQKIVDSGPVFKSAEIEGAAIRVRFDSIASGLVSKGGPLRQFAIAGRDRKWRWAEARIDGDSVIVSHPDLPQPAWVRYAWADNPEGANLFNSEGLPAAPFRTDP
jgi:sialate O-acetylesterase